MLYTIIEADHAALLAERVNKRIESGWEPLGGVNCANVIYEDTLKGGQANQNWFSQAMVHPRGSPSNIKEDEEPAPDEPEEGQAPVPPSHNSESLMTLRDAEEHLVLTRLESFGGNKTKTAKSLGVDFRTLETRLKKYQERNQ